MSETSIEKGYATQKQREIKETAQENPVEIEPEASAQTGTEALKSDARYAAIREEVSSRFMKASGEDRNTGPYSANFQDKVFGSSQNRELKTFDEETAEAFAERYPEDAKKYEQQERIKVYAGAELDPAVRDMEKNVLASANRSPAANKSAAEWQRVHRSFSKSGYESLVRDYPEKAGGYTQKWNEFTSAHPDFPRPSAGYNEQFSDWKKKNPKVEVPSEETRTIALTVQSEKERKKREALERTQKEEAQAKARLRQQLSQPTEGASDPRAEELDQKVTNSAAAETSLNATLEESYSQSAKVAREEDGPEEEEFNVLSDEQRQRREGPEEYERASESIRVPTVLFGSVKKTFLENNISPRELGDEALAALPGIKEKLRNGSFESFSNKEIGVMLDVLLSLLGMSDETNKDSVSKTAKEFGAFLRKKDSASQYENKLGKLAQAVESKK